MKLYTYNGEWFGTQADARKAGAPTDPIEVPVDKAGLLEFLNAHRVGHAPGLTMEPQAPATAAPTAGPTLSPRHALFEAAASASLQDLQHVVYRYMLAIDDEFDLRRQ